MKKLVKLDKHMGCAMSGLVADARTLVEHGRVVAQNHWFTYNEQMGVEATVQSICDLAMRFGEGGQARPFGVSLLCAGVDENGPCLYHTDPAGTMTKYLAKAIGAGSEGAQTALQDQYHKSLTLDEAKKIGLEILKQVMEDSLNEKNVEMAVVTTENPVFTFVDKTELSGMIKTLAADLI
jgi:20S proteasome subunit alpha 5